MNDLGRRKRNVNIKTMGALLLALLLILTFVSKTVYNYNLPVVTATTPLNGKLNKAETVKGIAEWADKVEVYASTGGYVEDVFVQKGDSVTKGQALARLSLSEDELSEKRDATYELQQLEMEIRNAEEDCSKTKKLYEEGAVARSEYEEEDRALQALYAKKQKMLLDNQGTSNSNLLTVYAAEDSVVSELSVHKGQKVNSGDLVATCGLSKDFEINCRIALDNNFVVEGDACKLDNSSHSLDGIVTEVKAEEEKKMVSVLIQSDAVKVGETFDVKFEKESSESKILVPNGALNRDGDGYFLYQVKQREGILGKEFYVEKVKVNIGDNDIENTIIAKGVTFFEPIVLLCDKELAEGDTVILENEGDFFAE